MILLKIMLTKPKFWDKKFSFITIILIPFSLIFLFVNFIRKKFSKKNLFNTQVICVGNIYLGGTGKTPLSIFLANEISKLGKKIAILRKYYVEHNDEYDLIRKNFKNLIINKNRVDGIKEAEKLKFDAVILDDGFQDYKIEKDLSIICFNSNQQIGNGYVLPAGPLRENINSLKNVDIVIINGKKDMAFEEKILRVNDKLEIFYSSYHAQNIDQLENKKLLALAAIGNPENFFELLEKNNLTIERKISFPDHYNYSKKEIKKIIDEAENKNLQVVMTEKDYYKVKDYNFKNIKFVKVSLEIYNQERLFELLKNKL